MKGGISNNSKGDLGLRSRGTCRRHVVVLHTLASAALYTLHVWLASLASACRSPTIFYKLLP